MNLRQSFAAALRRRHRRTTKGLQRLSSPAAACFRDMREQRLRSFARGLCDAGVPGSAVRLENRSQNTMENFRFAAQMLPGAQRVLVVTSDYHVCRAVATARRVGLRARGRGARLAHDAAWCSCLLKEGCYTLDLFLGWQDGEGRRPAWTRPLFNRIFGIQA